MISLCTSGNRTYVGYVYTEITVNNAVVRVFIKIMQDTVDGKKATLPHGRGAHLRLRGQCKTTSDHSSDACDDGEVTMLHMYHRLRIFCAKNISFWKFIKFHG